jgi:hypothetical protein
MRIMENNFLGNSLETWLAAAGIAILVYFGEVALRRMILRQIRAFAARTETKLDDLAADLLGDVKWFLLVTLAVYIGSTALTLSNKACHFLDIALIIAFLIQGGIWGNWIINYLIE